MVEPLQAVGSQPPDSPEKIQDAARQFEALLLTQILKGMRAGESGLGDSSAQGDAVFELAEQEFAKALAASGGLGLARLIADGLTRSPSQGNATTPNGMREVRMSQEIAR